MKYYIGNYTYLVKGKKRKEYYIAEGSDIVAGDFKSYSAAKSYIKSTLSKRTR